MKIVWHWKNIGKSVIVIFIVGVALSFLNLPKPLGFFVGALVGVFNVLVITSIWDLWHFEDID